MIIALILYSITLSPTRINLSLLKKSSTITKLTGTLFEPFLLHIPGILASILILPLLPLSSLTQFSLVWIFLFPLPISLAKSIRQSGSILIEQRLLKLETTTSKHGNITKLHSLELHLYKPIIYAAKLSTMLEPPLSTASAIRLLHIKLDLAPPCP